MGWLDFLDLGGFSPEDLAAFDLGDLGGITDAIPIDLPDLSGLYTPESWQVGTDLLNSGTFDLSGVENGMDTADLLAQPARFDVTGWTGQSYPFHLTEDWGIEPGAPATGFPGFSTKLNDAGISSGSAGSGTKIGDLMKAASGVASALGGGGADQGGALARLMAPSPMPSPMSFQPMTAQPTQIGGGGQADLTSPITPPGYSQVQLAPPQMPQAQAARDVIPFTPMNIPMQGRGPAIIQPQQKLSGIQRLLLAAGG